MKNVNEDQMACSVLSWTLWALHYRAQGMLGWVARRLGHRNIWPWRKVYAMPVFSLQRGKGKSMKSLRAQVRNSQCFCHLDPRMRKKSKHLERERGSIYVFAFYIAARPTKVRLSPFSFQHPRNSKFEQRFYHFDVLSWESRCSKHSSRNSPPAVEQMLCCQFHLHPQRWNFGLSSSRMDADKVIPARFVTNVQHKTQLAQWSLSALRSLFLIMKKSACPPPPTCNRKNGTDLCSGSPILVA